MKKIAIVLLGTILLTGCTVVRISSNIDIMTDVILSKNNNLFNHVGKGYKYYVPRGVTYIDTDEYNEKLYSSGNYYYLYVDVISYYHKKDFNYDKDESAYFSKKIDNNNKKGYLEINKLDNGKYYIEFMYNYAKIECQVEKDQIGDAILNSSYILSTIKFNRKVIKIMLQEDYFTNKEETYDIFESKKVNTNFLEVGNENS